MAKRRQDRDPFADYVEWTRHRYDPGHYLGGTLPPHLRKSSLGRKGRRNAGVLLMIMAVLAFGGFLAAAQSGSDRMLLVVAALWPLLPLAAGLRMLSSARRKSGDPK